MKALFNKYVLILCAISVLVASTMPSSNVPSVGFDHFDKIAHVVMYTVLSALICGYAIRVYETSSLKRAIVCFLLASAYGLLMEILQHCFFESRSFEFYDIISNIIGSLIGVIFVNNFFNSKK